MNFSIKFFLSQFFLLFFLASFLFAYSSTTQVERKIADDGSLDISSQRSAFEIWAELQESATKFSARAVNVDGNLTVGNLPAGVTWGAEKEASSGLITRVMGPSANQMKQFVQALPENQRREFLRDFLHNYVKDANGYRTYRKDGVVYDLARDVVDVDGNSRAIDLSGLRGINYLEAELDVLDERFAHFLSLTDERPLSFIKPSVRMKLFKGRLPGLSSGLFHITNAFRNSPNYSSWTPLFGKPQRYIMNAHNTSVGWEINFNPVATYGEFEEFVYWFRSELENAGKLFQAPGHQRMVFRQHPNLNRAGLAELYRAIQALIVVDGIKGKTGIERASFKSVLSDEMIKELRSGRGVIRLEGNRFGEDTLAVEFRAGTKDIRLARFLQTSLAARVAANEFDDLAQIDSYALYRSYSDISPENIARRFNVSLEVANQAFENLRSARVFAGYQIPFWQWESEGLPFMSRDKKELIRGMTKDFVEQVAALSNNDVDFEKNVRASLREWIKATNLSEDLHNYIRPKRSAQMTNDILQFYPHNFNIRHGVSSLTDELLNTNRFGEIDFDLERVIVSESLENPNFGRQALYDHLLSRGHQLEDPSVIDGVWRAHQLTDVEARREKASLIGQASNNFPDGMVDVNRIDLGIEYSGRMPLRLRADYSVDRLANDQRAWIMTHSDLTQQERTELIRRIADDLRVELNGQGQAQRVVDANGHGHGLDIAYEIRDAQNRKWVVEWDGISRSYTSAGTIIPESARGGSIELVTPKFVPTADEMRAVFNVFHQNNILPQLRSGGGHINVDLAAFENNPRALARFISLFNEHRGIISLMFQRINRLRNAEAIDISSNLARTLADFNGSEQDLKQLLYNERYFNTRYGRKTRYLQLDMSAYFQDVIPAEFITEDFDIKSPTQPWRRQFRVDPNIRKAEFRLFNAPRTAVESALQIRLVRALLHKAINEDGPLSGSVQRVDHQAYLANPERAYQDLERMARELQLNPNDFRPAVAEGLSETDIATRSQFFVPLSEKLRLNPRQPGWSQAVGARSADQALSSEGRQWVFGAADQLNTMDHQHYIQSVRQAEQIRANIIPERVIQGRFRRTQSCIDLMSPFLRAN